MAISKLSNFNDIKASSAQKAGPAGTNIVEFFPIPALSSSPLEQYFTVPTGVTQITAVMWGAGGSSYYDGTQSGYGGAGGYCQTTFNVAEKELTILVGSATYAGSYSAGGYPGGGNSANGGAAGGAASMIISGRKSGMFTSTSVGGSYGGFYYAPTASTSALAGATDIIAVAGGGGGAGWYGTNAGSLHGGPGGGITAASGTGQGTAGGGTQTAGGAAGNGNSSSGGFLYGGSGTTNLSSGGQGGGGGGWYGGGGGYHVGGGNNGGGGGGSSFAGYANGSTSTALTATEVDGYNYANSAARKNGIRTYSNTYLWRAGNAGTSTPSYTSSQPGIATNVYTTSVGQGGYPSAQFLYGDGKVVLIY